MDKDLEQAVKLVDSVLGQVKLNRGEHEMLVKAMQLIYSALAKKEEKDNG